VNLAVKFDRVRERSLRVSFFYSLFCIYVFCLYSIYLIVNKVAQNRSINNIKCVRGAQYTKNFTVDEYTVKCVLHALVQFLVSLTSRTTATM